MLEIEGLDLKMIVTLGENGVKTVEDLAGCVTDDLTGWTERVDGEKKHYDGILESYKLKAEDAEKLIMRARIAAGWVTQEDLDKAAADAAAAKEAAAGQGAQ
jgi:N utilization substance protein A